MGLLDTDKIIEKVKVSAKEAFAENIPMINAFFAEQKKELTEYVSELEGDINSSLAFIAFCNTAGKFIITSVGADGKPTVQYRKAEHLKAFQAITDAYNDIVAGEGDN